jgi:hypothetical protein
MKQRNSQLIHIADDAATLLAHPWLNPVEIFTILANVYAVEKKTIGQTPTYSLATLGRQLGLDIIVIRRIMNYGSFRAEQCRRATNPGGYRYGRPQKYVLDDGRVVTK